MKKSVVQSKLENLKTTEKRIYDLLPEDEFYSLHKIHSELRRIYEVV